jgi:hypothetical protein
MVFGFMDETGHSKDERQRFNGMAGLIAPWEHWEGFERKWKKTLKLFHIPHFHMNEFEHSERARPKDKNIFKGWDARKKKKLIETLYKHIESVYPYPIGSSLCMDDFKSLTPAQQAMFDDPYYMGFTSVLAYVGGFLDREGAASTERAAIVFDNQVEFKGRADEIFEKAYSDEPFIKRRIDRPCFRDMRDVVPLQAADIVAYEMYKEHDRRRYRPLDSPREGYQRLEQMARRLVDRPPLFRFRSEVDLLEDVRAIEAEHRRIAYWRKRQGKSK